MARLGPGVAIALTDDGAAWADADAGVRRLAEMARREATCDPQHGQHTLVLLGERGSGKSVVARALLKHLLDGPAAGSGEAAGSTSGALADRPRTTLTRHVVAWAGALLEVCVCVCAGV